MRFLLGADEYDPILDVIATELGALGHEVTRIGAEPAAPVPWATVAIAVADAVAFGAVEQGVVCCHTGTGVTIAANKVPGVRAALCVDAATARGARQWNDANVLTMSLRLTSPTVAKEIVRAWIETPYGGTENESLDAIRRAERSKM